MRTILLISYCIFAYAVSAQVKFETGDTELDNDLTVINANAKQDLTGFNKELTDTYGITSKNIDYMTSIKMEPAEMFFAAELSKATGKTIDEVVSTYEKNREKGWGYVAQQLGIKPGSPEFHALKDKSKAKKEKGAQMKEEHSNSGNGNKNGQEKSKTKTKTKKTT